MKTLLALSTALLVVLAATPAHADRKLANSKNCLACHGINEKAVGPALNAVAAKYAGQADAAAMLAGRIKAGSTGIWGNVPMPANDVTADEAKQLADWVLSLK